MSKCRCDSCYEARTYRKQFQASDPARPLRRGFFKGERPKSLKARLDELLQASKNFFYYLDAYEDAKGRHAKYVKKYGPRHPYWTGLAWRREMLTTTRKRYLALLAQCEADGIIRRASS